MTDPVTIHEADIEAYIDDQLDAEGRIRVESFLASHPDTAARVMADLGIRSSLKLAIASQQTDCSPKTRHAAHKLQSGLSEARMWQTLRKIAAVGILVSLGWFANTSMGAREVNATAHPPAFVEQAMRAHDTALVRAGMESQPESRAYDRDDIRAATAITMPDLPEGWQVVDVQVFPSDFGPSVEAVVKTADGTAISLFAGRPGSFSVEAVQAVTLADAEAAWWQLGEVAYAVVSRTSSAGLSDEAELLKNTLY